MKLRSLAIITALALPSIAYAQATPPPPPPQPTPTLPSEKSPPDKTNEKTTNAPTDKAPDKTAKGGKLSEGDVKIVAHVHHVNVMEIDAGKLAQKSGTATVKNYGEMLERDHQSADKDLVSYAKAHKLNAIPADKPESDADKQEAKDMMKQMAHLKTLKGADFDKEFLNMMVAGHDKELAKIDVSISAAADPDLQAMLKNVKPVLQRHADQARDLQKSPQAMNDKLPAQK